MIQTSTFVLETRLGKREFRMGNPLLIAEVGVNHEGSMTLARQMIDECQHSAVGAVKFQTYKAERLAAKDSPSYWNTNYESCLSQRELFKKYDSFDREHYKLLADHAYERGLLFMSTAFDLISLEFIDELVDIHKVSSSDITNIPLLRAIGSKGKPVLLSCGASTINEIKSAVDVLSSTGALEVIPLHCVLNYPTENNQAFLSRILEIQREFPNNHVGYSDHTIPDENMTQVLYAHLLGANVIEKHYTFNKGNKGNDHYHAFDKQDLKSFSKTLRGFCELYGTAHDFNLESQELARRNARRGIYAARDIAMGELILESDLITLRPIQGVPAEAWDMVVGKRATRSIGKESPIAFSDLI
jgi:sialic acid synthase SpsE